MKTNNSASHISGVHNENALFFLSGPYGNEDPMYMPYPLNEYYEPESSEESGLRSLESGNPLQDLSGEEASQDQGSADETFLPMRK